MNGRIIRGKHKIIFGVCSGIAEFIDIDPTIIRLITALFGVFFPLTVLFYLVAGLIMPKE